MIVAAMVNRTFRSSMEVGVRVEEEDSRTGARHHCCSAYLTFVALARNDPGGPSPAKRTLPKVVPTERHHERIHAEAASRCGGASRGCLATEGWRQWTGGGGWVSGHISLSSALPADAADEPGRSHDGMMQSSMMQSEAT